MNFWNMFVELCNETGKTPNAVAKEIGIPSGSVTAWKRGAMPHAKTINRLADYFGVTVEYLLGKEKSSGSAELGEKDRKLIEAYHRSEPVIQSTVDKLLGIEEKTITVKIAARDGTYEEKVLTKEEWEKIQGLPDADL